jgi:hypothetical protein
MALVLVKEEFHEIVKVELLSFPRDIEKSVSITGAGGGPVAMDTAVYNHIRTIQLR